MRVNRALASVVGILVMMVAGLIGVLATTGDDGNGTNASAVLDPDEASNEDAADTGHREALDPDDRAPPVVDSGEGDIDAPFGDHPPEGDLDGGYDADNGEGQVNDGFTTRRHSDLPEISVYDLPSEAIDTLQLIEDGGPYPYSQDDGTFQNREGLLPDHPRGHYREYTVETPGSNDRGARRIVAGDDGERYWTDDHYRSFHEIVFA